MNYSSKISGTTLANSMFMQNSTATQSLDFSSLDEGFSLKKYAAGQNSGRIRFFIEGISCSKCVGKLEDLRFTIPGVRSFQVEMGKNVASVEIDPEILTFSKLAQKISELGFHPIPLVSNDEEIEKLAKEQRKELVRLAVGGACAGNIMTFSFATYLGADAGLGFFLAWLSFGLYLPVLFYVAVPFYKGAIASLKRREISIDLPMAVASLAGFFFSTVELIRGRTDFYFDSISGFLFLILVARYAQRKMQSRFLRGEGLTDTFKLERVRVLQGRDWQWKSLSDLKVGDRIVVEAGETMPVEGELTYLSSHISLAWLTGEVKAKTYLQGAIVPAGAQLLSSEAMFIVRKLLPETAFGKILEEIQTVSLSQNRMVSLSDKWAQKLLLTVFSVGFLFLVAYSFVSTEEAIRRSLALIVLACPCAMAFGTPLALASALRKSRRQGLIIQNADVFEKAAAIQTIFFDKTGTLTETDLRLVQRPEAIPAIYQKIILSLENISAHPMAFAFRKAFPQQLELLPVERLREIPGTGVSGYIFGRFYEVRSSQSSSEDITCVLLEDKKEILEFSFQANLKPDCFAALKTLRQKGYRLVLLSGDRKPAVDVLARELQFEAENTFSQLSPREKAAIVARTPNSMVVGDGVNDSLALQKASVGVAASGGMEMAMKSSQVFLTNSSLLGVVQLLSLSQESQSLIRQNLRISVVYNSLGGIFALLGFINPLVAAILMPLSSGFILLNTWIRGSR